MSTTLRVPFRLDGGRVQTTTNTTTQVEQKIINVMVTRTLERTGLPEYGGNVESLAFSDPGGLEFEDYKVDLATEVSQSVTGVTIQDIVINPSETYMNITVIYTLPLVSPRQFTFRLAQPGTITQETPL